MNLKEAFRYQNFLDRVFGAAAISIQVRDHCLTQTREHLCNKVNPDADDFREEGRILPERRCDPGYEISHWREREAQHCNQ